MANEPLTKEERFWGVEFYHTLGWTPCTTLSLTRNQAREALKHQRARSDAFKYRLASYVRKTP